MYCQNCGKQIPDGATFCSYCGAKQGAVAQTQTPKTAPEPTIGQQTAFQGAQQNAVFNMQQAAQPNMQQTAPPNMQQVAPSNMQQQKPKKKWTSFLIPVLVFFLCALLGKYVLAPAMQSNKDSGQDNGKPTLPSLDVEEVVRPEGLEDETGDGEGSEVNPEYSELFFGTKVIHLPLLFGMDVESFAEKFWSDNYAEEMISCVDVGYQGEQVLTVVLTQYITDLSKDQDEQKFQGITEDLQTIADHIEDMTFVKFTYSYDENNEYFVAQIECTDLDQAENVQALAFSGLSGLNLFLNKALGSVSDWEKDLLDQGYIKK